MKEKTTKNEIISLNSEISEFQVKALEKRLETDPLAVGGLLDVNMNDDDAELCSSNDDDCEKCGGLFVCNIKR